MADMHIHAPLCIAAGAIFPPVCAGLVALRFYARRQQGNGLKLDDYLTIPALVCWHPGSIRGHALISRVKVMVIGMCAATLNGEIGILLRLRPVLTMRKGSPDIQWATQRRQSLLATMH